MRNRLQIVNCSRDTYIFFQQCRNYFYNLERNIQVSTEMKFSTKVNKLNNKNEINSISKLKIIKFFTKHMHNTIKTCFRSKLIQITNFTNKLD